MIMEDTKAPNMVFVYGTLRKGFANHRIMRQARGEFVADVRTSRPYPLVINGLPFLYDEPGTGKRVKGELYALPDEEGLARLDRLEGHPEFYTRKLIEIEDGAGNRTFVWTYFHNSERDRDLPCHEQFTI